MAVRNFWIDATADGRQTDIAGGPRAKTGGMEGTVYIRDEGAIEKGFSFDCRANGDELILNVFDGEGRNILHQRTKR